MAFVKVAEFPPGLDTTLVADTLRAEGIEHRLVEEGGVVVLYVSDDQPLEQVVEVVKASLEELQRQVRPWSGGSQGPVQGFGEQFRRTPATVMLLLLGLLGAALVHWQLPLLHWFTFQDFSFVNDREIVFSTLSEALDQGQYWRLITPIFIHFGIFHIAFNGLWIWEFGRRVESHGGSLHLLLVVLVTALISNAGQYLWEGPSLFGGLSGVLYGLLGYLWVFNRLAPAPVLALPKGVIGFMLAWLVICMSGVVDFFFRGSIANAAHAYGLVSGMLLGAMFGMVRRIRTS